MAGMSAALLSAWREVSALGSTADVTQGAVSGKLSAVVKGALLADHSCFPVARGGLVARPSSIVVS
eukprot:6478481-Amphidinium_carterae.2